MKKRKLPYFETYSSIKFELDPSGTGPRWNLNRDEGYSGKWAYGVITEVNEVAIETLVTINKIPIRFNFPNWGSVDFELDQWWYPGYLQLDEESKIQKCDCGCKGLGYHWNFCSWQKWEEERNANS